MELISFRGDYQALATAILWQAVRDWQSINRIKRKTEADYKALAKIEKFLVSEYGEILSFGMGEEILDRLYSGGGAAVRREITPRKSTKRRRKKHEAQSISGKADI